MSVKKISICVTCLSQNRKLFPVKKILDQMNKFCSGIRPLLRLSEDSSICWECRSRINNMASFVHQASEAQELLKQIYKGTKHKSLSKLSIHKTSTLSCDGVTDDCNMHDQDAKIKDENASKTNAEFVGIDNNLNGIGAKTKNNKNSTNFENYSSIIKLEDNAEDYENVTDNGNFSEFDQKIKKEGVCKDESSLVKIKIDNLPDGIKAEPTEVDNEGKTSEVGVGNSIDLHTMDDDDDSDSDCVLSTIAQRKGKKPSTVVKDNIARKVRGGIVTEMYKIKDITDEELMEVRRERMKKIANYRFKCDKCVENLFCEEIMLKHTKKHESSDPFPCKVCEQKFPSQYVLVMHLQSHYRCYECLSCDFKTDKMVVIKRHYDRQHDTRGRKCRACGEYFPTLTLLKKHQRESHSSGFTCEECGKKFNARHSFLRHMHIHTGAPAIECQVCHKQCRGQWGLYAHMRSHEDKIDESAYCAECDIQFKTQYTFRKHLRNSLKHNTDRHKNSYQCPHCEKSVSKRYYLKDHIEAVHGSENKYSCNVCNAEFKSKIRLRVHARVKHQGKGKDKICHICSRAFNSEANLKEHMNVHTGARPFICSTCGEAFSHSSAMYKHNRQRHKKGNEEGGD